MPAGLQATFLQQDPLQQGILVAQHQAFVCRTTVALLQALQRLLIVLNGSLQLLDILGPPLTEGGLCLSVALLALLRRGIDLFGEGGQQLSVQWRTHDNPGPRPSRWICRDEGN